jgi:hypothetical protein
MSPTAVMVPTCLWDWTIPSEGHDSSTTVRMRRGLVHAVFVLRVRLAPCARAECVHLTDLPRTRPLHPAGFQDSKGFLVSLADPGNAGWLASWRYHAFSCVRGEECGVETFVGNDAVLGRSALHRTHGGAVVGGGVRRSRVPGGRFGGSPGSIKLLGPLGF